MTLSTQKLTLSAGTTHICQELTLTIRPGEIWTILGKNGTGKTQLLHCLAGLIPPDSGNVFWHQKTLQRLSKKTIAQHIGLLLQDNTYDFPIRVIDAAFTGRYPHLNAWQQVTQEDIHVVEKALADFSLTELKNRFAHTLSGGEKRRLAIANLIAQQPQCYLLDEPLNHLDIAYQRKTLNYLRKLAKTKRASIITSLHNIDDAKAISDYVLILLGNAKFLMGQPHEALTEKVVEQLCTV